MGPRLVLFSDNVFSVSTEVISTQKYIKAVFPRQCRANEAEELSETWWSGNVENLILVILKENILKNKSIDQLSTKFNSTQLSE